jgi:hypothetical protein
MVPPKIIPGPGAQNVKKGLNALRTAENESGSMKHENGTRRTRHCRKRDPTPSVLPKRSSGAQNLKIGPEALETVENKSGGQNMKTGTEALGTAETDSGSVKHENGTRRPQNRPKRVRERKT